uniref:KH domain-containing protein n=1 Tax=Caenorhabditis tropicalis TaxID=1561998 RepID=A0A1I7USR8_9PELO
MVKIEEFKTNFAGGDHHKAAADCSGSSGVELKSLLKQIDNVIETSSSKAIPRLPLHSGFVTLSETLLVPVNKFPQYNFVGRILGPRGMTVKALEKETGCKIFVRGRAFMSHKTARIPPPRSSLSNVSKNAFTDDPLHVFIQCTDFPEIAQSKMSHAISIMQELLSPPPDGKDELKRQQLVDISLINGTYRATSSSNEIGKQFHRQNPRHNVDPTSHPIHELDLQPLSSEYGGPSKHDLGLVYEIAQQRRVWQKPRGPDTHSVEYARSVSSREFISDIVNKTKKSPVKTPSNDQLYQLPETVVNKTLEVANNLLASHRHLTFDLHERQVQKQAPPPSPAFSQSINGSGDFALPDFSIPPPPIQTMASEYPYYYVYPTPSHIPYGSFYF